MDYNLKKENRKKFQDKSKLKRHHKKDYSKVIPKESNKQEPEKPIEDEETEYEDVSEPEVDDQGNFVLHGDQIEAVNDEGERVVRRKKIDKTKTNVWRYRDEMEISGLDADEEELMKSIDFKKLDFHKIDSKQEKSKDYKRMNKDELQNIKIIDERFDSKETTTEPTYEYEDDIDSFLRSNSSDANKIREDTIEKPKHENKTPAFLKADEAFLDDLI